ncbi:MAG TPA: MFS transporter [Thermomicrobiales bacterium]|nr:MFS transporter [Thermomicrobiales bacterium]
MTSHADPSSSDLEEPPPLLVISDHAGDERHTPLGDELEIVALNPEIMLPAVPASRRRIRVTRPFRAPRAAPADAALPARRLNVQLPRALQHPPYRRYWLAQIVALMGMWTQNTGVQLVILSITSSAFLVGAINIVSALPLLALSLFGGVVADRFERRRILLLTQPLIGSISLIWALLVFSGHLAYWHILVLVALGGVVSSFDLPAGQAFLAQLVRREDMPEAIALNSASINATRTAGPAFSAFIIGAFGLAFSFVTFTLSLLAPLLVLVSLRRLLPPAIRHASGTVRPSGLSALRDGLRHIRHSDDLFGLVATTGIFSFLAVPSLLVLMPLYVTTELHGSRSWVPTMISVFGVGSLLGAILLLRGSRLEAAGGRRLKVTAAGLACGLLWLALSPNPWIAIPGVLIAGCSFEMGLMQITTRVQQLAPEELRGRVLSINGLAFNGVMPFSTLTISAAAQAIGLPIVMGACSVLLAIGSLAIWRRYTWKAFLPAEVAASA